MKDFVRDPVVRAERGLGGATGTAPRQKWHGPRESWGPTGTLARAHRPVLADGEGAADDRSKWR